MVQTKDDFPQGDELDHRYIIGVDLGTTNSAVAYIDLTETPDRSGRRAIQQFSIPQLIGPGDIATRAVLPSYLYLPGEYDLSPESTELPWDAEREYVVGEFARAQGARVPGRLVSSAKSWLSHAAVDRTAPILPWGAGDDVPKVSPVAASARYLQHIREAWNERMADGRDGYFFNEQLIILTVPASFDEVARELTIQAAHEAGIQRVILLEEPLAAFYAWLFEHEDSWQAQMADGQLILVCDVGGGTTDFSIVGIRAGEGGLRFNRLAVGEHLMLGGDNMDMTLGRHLETELVGQPGKLETGRWQQLVHQCRQAKEELLDADEADAAVDISVVGSGGKLIGDTLRGTLSRAEVQRLILDGFFPQVARHEAPDAARRSGIAELGLPYVRDPAITRHLAAFWQRFADLLRTETGRDVVYPDFILFNGGTLIPTSIRTRVCSVIGDWFGEDAGADWQPTELDNPDHRVAVALGAAYYGLVRLGEGVSVGSGSPRAYYVGVEAGERASQQGFHTAVCLVPRGAEEGFETTLAEPEFAALTNQPVAFQVFTSSTRLGDQLGDVVQLPPDEVSELPPIQTVLRYGKGAAQRIPIQLGVRLTAIGTLELWCVSQQSNHRWQLQFDVREAVDADAAPREQGETLDQALVEAAQREIEQTFQRGQTEAHPPEQLRAQLEEILELDKEKWPTPVIRQLADTFLEALEGAAISAEHEARWLNLAGFCLRPGFGDPVDEWRLKQVWKLHFNGLHFPQKTQNRIEWWIFWRRVAGGLNAGKQTQIAGQIRPLLEPGKSRKKSNKMYPKHLGAAEALEIWMALANFERLPAQDKVSLGALLLRKFRKNSPRPQELWALSRLGNRQPVYGPQDRVIPSAVAAEWLETLLAMKLKPSSGAAYCLVLLARYTGDRARDVPDELRMRVAAWLDQLDDAQRLREILLEPHSSLRQEEEDWIFGESLPSGLVLSAVEE